jgi:hypothetical protein
MSMKNFDMKPFVFINEDEEGVIIFVDQQKTFDRMEWGWLNYVMECFNFGLKFREWVYMLFKKGKHWESHISNLSKISSNTSYKSSFIVSQYI